MGRLHLFDGFGVELEYMVVDSRTLDVLPVVDRLLEAVAGAVVSDFDAGPLSWSNELVLHVVELKTNGPARSMDGLDSLFQDDVGKVNRVLGGLGGMLLPTAMHPWMDPKAETTLWPHDYSPIYESYDRIFGCQGHGWSNLQSTHLNLPFATDEEFGRLHAAIRLILPILPALTASSPLVEGRPTGVLDNRMEFYRHNSRAIPSVTGHVIPEPVFRRADYESQVLDRMYADVAPLDPAGILQDEFLNSRGAIPRFQRGSIEIRVMDVQESPAADLAYSALAVGAVRLLVEEGPSSWRGQQTMAVEPLASILLDCVRMGDRARVDDRSYLELLGYSGGAASAAEIWWHLLERVGDEGFLTQPGRMDVLKTLLGRGPLAREILRALGLEAGPRPAGGDPVPREALKELYARLAGCLGDGSLFFA